MAWQPFVSFGFCWDLVADSAGLGGTWTGLAFVAADLQAQQVEGDRAVFARVSRNACEAGALPEAAAIDVELQIEPPTLAMRDRSQEAQIYKLQHLSTRTISQPCERACGATKIASGRKLR